MDDAILAEKLRVGQRLGITITSMKLVYSCGFTGTYQFVYGVKKEEFPDATIQAIAEELTAMQSTARLLVGSFFIASMNCGDGRMYADIFCGNAFDGAEYVKQIQEKFLDLMYRFTAWLQVVQQ